MVLDHLKYFIKRMVKKKSSKIVSIINKYKENSDIQIYKEEINNILDKKKKE